MRILIVAALVIFGSVSSANADTSAFSPIFGGKIKISVTTTASSATAIGAGEQIYCVNEGSQAAFIKCGNSAVAATTSDMPILGDSPAVFTCNLGLVDTKYLSAITEASTTTLHCIAGNGL